MHHNTVTRLFTAFVYLVVDLNKDSEKIKGKQKSPSFLH